MSNWVQMIEQAKRQQQERAAAEETQRVAAAKAALIVGYESGFQLAAEGTKKDAATLAEGVVSAEHIPVAKDKVATGKSSVLLLINGLPVQSLPRGGLDYVPVQAIDGAAAADAFEVVMEAPTLLYRTNAEAQARKEKQIFDTQKRITDATDTLAELRESLGRNESELKAAVESPDGNVEVSDIGAMVLEQQRIKKEINSQQASLEAQTEKLQQLLGLTDDQLEPTDHRITPQFRLHGGFNLVPASDEAKDAQGQVTQAKMLVQVLRLSQIPAASVVHFRPTVDEQP